MAWIGRDSRKYVHKGDKLYIEGKIRTRSYDDQAGIKRYVTEIFADNMEMLSPKATAPAPQPVQGAQPASSQPAASQAMPAQDNAADDLPF